MNDLQAALTAHYNAQSYFCFIDPDHARAVPYGFTGPAYTIVWREALTDVDKVVSQLQRLAEHAPYSEPVLATWADGITTGDVAALEAEGVRVITLERVLEVSNA